MSHADLVGRVDRLALFTNGHDAAIMDTGVDPDSGFTAGPVALVATGSLRDLLGRFNWQDVYPGVVPLTVHQAAAMALGTGPDIEIERLRKPHNETNPSVSRVFTVPKAVRAAAQRGLTAAARVTDLDPAAVITGRQLASGTPITLIKLRQIVRAHSGSSSSMSSAVTQLLWGGTAGRRWANGVLNKHERKANVRGHALTAAAAPTALPPPGSSYSTSPDINSDPAAVEAAMTGMEPFVDDGNPDWSPEKELVFAPDATEDDVLDALRAVSEPLTNDDLDVIYDRMAEGPHAFLANDDDPPRCLACWGGANDPLHDITIQTDSNPNAKHVFNDGPPDADPDICAVCGKDPHDPIHSLTFASVSPEPPPVTASYLPTQVIDAPPAIIAAILSEETYNDVNCDYFGALAPGAPTTYGAPSDLHITGIFKSENGAWYQWNSGTESWVSTGQPDVPLQLLDEDAAMAVLDELGSDNDDLDSGGVPLHGQDPEEDALFEAARDVLGDNLNGPDRSGRSYLSETPGEDVVTYTADVDSGDGTMVTRLAASTGGNCFSWNYMDGRWNSADCLDLGLDSPQTVDFDTAAAIAAQLSTDGIATLEPPDDVAAEAVDKLADTNFFDLFSSTLLTMPDDTGNLLDSEPEPEPEPDDAFYFSLDDRNAQARALHVSIPDTGLNTEWLTWDPKRVAWVASAFMEPPENLSPPMSLSRAAEFAAWQFMQEHGGTVDPFDVEAMTAAGTSDRLFGALQGAEFASAFGKIVGLLNHTEPYVQHVEPGGLTAAPGITDSSDVASPTEEYTAEERSKNAKKQVRDRFGRFAIATSRVALQGGQRGTISKIDPERQTVEVQGDDGKVYDVPANTVQVIHDGGPPGGDVTTGPIDTSKIEAQPRATARTPKGFLPYTLKQMDAAAIRQVVDNYQKFIDTERAAEAQRRRAGLKLGKAAEKPRR
jgi:hypothetical protein